MTIDHLYQDGRHYDQLYAGIHRDLSFWISQAKQYGDPILELACGTGRLAMPLAREGFAVTGIDRSDAMLSQARKKSAAENVRVEWINGDMLDFDLGQRFALIILAANALCHLLDLPAVESCMACVKTHLREGGRFIVDVFVPRMDLLLDKPGERFPFGEYDDPDGRGRVVVTHSYRYEPDTQIKRIRTYYMIPGTADEVEGALNMRMYFPQELDALLRYNGFKIEHKFGNYDQTAFDAKSQKQIIVCSAA